MALDKKTPSRPAIDREMPPGDRAPDCRPTSQSMLLRLRRFRLETVSAMFSCGTPSNKERTPVVLFPFFSSCRNIPQWKEIKKYRRKIISAVRGFSFENCDEKVLREMAMVRNRKAELYLY